MENTLQSLSLDEHYVKLNPDSSTDVLEGGPVFWEKLMQGEYGNLENEYLVTTFTFSEDWPTWENHVNGDEIVFLLSGKAEFFLELAEGTKSIMVDTAGHYVRVPKNTWHTAKTDVETRMLFITAGAGTQVRPA